jgi:hypothetical protein
MKITRTDKVKDTKFWYIALTIISLLLTVAARGQDSTITIDKKRFQLLVKYAGAEIQREKQHASTLTRIGYIAPMLAGFTLQGNADARTHTSRNKWKDLSPFARDDFWYLGVRHGVFIGGVSFAALGNYNANKNTRIRFVKDTAAIILIGSAFFDLAYSWERSGRPVMDLANWYQMPNGHKISISKKGMVWFNVSRIVVGTYLLVK